MTNKKEEKPDKEVNEQDIQEFLNELDKYLNNPDNSKDDRDVANN